MFDKFLLDAARVYATTVERKLESQVQLNAVQSDQMDKLSKHKAELQQQIRECNERIASLQSISDMNDRNLHDLHEKHVCMSDELINAEQLIAKLRKRK